MIMISIKPQIDRCRQMIASIEADARMSKRQKAELLSYMEGLFSAPAAIWRHRADKSDREAPAQPQTP